MEFIFTTFETFLETRVGKTWIEVLDWFENTQIPFMKTVHLEADNHQHVVRRYFIGVIAMFKEYPEFVCDHLKEMVKFENKNTALFRS